MSIFVDTGAWYAVADTTDRYHPEAAQFYADRSGEAAWHIALSAGRTGSAPPRRTQGEDAGLVPHVKEPKPDPEPDGWAPHPALHVRSASVTFAP